MTNADLPAFPQPEQHDAGKFTGLSKRELVATQIFAAIMTCVPNLNPNGVKKGDWQVVAVQHADKLLEELEKTKTKP